jgi:hypothetical protein
MNIIQITRLLLLGVVAVCVLARTVGSIDGPKTVQSKDNRVEITLPRGWRTTTLLGASERSIQATCPARNAFVEVISEAKQDLKHKSLLSYTRSIATKQSANSKLSERVVSEPREPWINGTKAIQCEIRGALKNVNLVYLDTFIETPTCWNQVLCWTTPSYWEDARDGDFRAIIESLKETTKSP